VHELRQGPVLRLDAELDPLGVAPALEHGAGDVDVAVQQLVLRAVLDDDLLLVDVGVPRQVVGLPL
jgi:hypothetical protein